MDTPRATCPQCSGGVHAYHTANGWCDIAYNALIDRFGRIWEGRAGGMENPVRSGATGGFNTDSWAISLIGNYSTTALPTTAYTALRDLTAWKLLANRRNPQGTAVLTQAEGGAALGALWTDGQPVTFNVISGHRDAKSTECPGNLAYPLLATLRRDVDQRMSANPRGSLDGLTSGFNSLTVRGWTFDPETPDPIYGWVSIDGGRFGGPMFSRDARPDVSAVYPGAGDRHGFRATFSVPPGAHEVCVHGVNWGAGHDTLITCAWTLVSPDPLGHLDAVTVTRGQITARGWALDPETADPTYAWIDVSGLGMPVVAGLRRPDIALVYPGVGADHGFSLSVARPPGEYVVCAYAVNLGVGRDRPIGCQRVRV